MKSKFMFTVTLMLLLGCSKGVWVTSSVYRPKKPRFSILKKEFVGNELINNAYIYLSTKRFQSLDGNVIGYMGFYPDGRIIIDSSFEYELVETLNRRNSYETASSIGYYTTKDNEIEVQFFVPGDGGLYETRKGVIKKDTIIFSEQYWGQKEARHEILVRSHYPLRE